MRKSIVLLLCLMVSFIAVQTALAEGLDGLLGVQVIEPKFSLDKSGDATAPTATYSTASQTLTISSTPLVFIEIAGGAPQLVQDGELIIEATIDSAGVLQSGSFSLSGAVGAYSGILLEGAIDKYGIVDLGTNDNIDFELYANGGSMLGLIPDGAAGATINLSNSTFAGSFSGDWLAYSNTGEIGFYPAPSPGACVQPQTERYWRRHPGQWPVDELTLGSKSYNKCQLLSILRRPGVVDKTFMLAGEQIAAKFNVIIQGGPNECIDCIQPTIDAVDAWLTENPVGSHEFNWEGIKGQWQDLRQFNRGDLCYTE